MTTHEHAAYQILKPLILSFNSLHDQYDLPVEPEDGHLEFDGMDIILVKADGDRLCSITMNHALNVWLKEGALRPLAEVPSAVATPNKAPCGRGP